jgi:hypothetical protein
VLGGDMLIFVLFKLARNDLRYSFNFPGAASWAFTFVNRLFTKIFVDFTVMVQLRHPQEIGGLYWIMCLVFGQATGFVALYLYSSNADDGGARFLPGLWVLLGAAEACFVIFFVTFVFSVESKYRTTFFSTITAKQFRIKAFRDATTDQIKMNILKLHPSYYKSIRGEVEKWVRDNYETWNDEQPEWFTERVRQRIPKDMIPKKKDQAKKKHTKKKVEEGKGRRRSSLQLAAAALRKATEELREVANDISLESAKQSGETKKECA